MHRLGANKELLSLLVYVIGRYPDMRFSQALSVFGFVREERPTVDRKESWLNEFYSEPQYVLERVKKRIDNYERSGNIE